MTMLKYIWLLMRHLCVKSPSLSLSNPSVWNTEVSMQIIKYFLSAMPHRPPPRVYKWSLNHILLTKAKIGEKKNLVKTTLIGARVRTGGID